jgi:hypothetical protein
MACKQLSIGEKLIHAFAVLFLILPFKFMSISFVHCAYTAQTGQRQNLRNVRKTSRPQAISPMVKTLSFNM